MEGKFSTKNCGFIDIFLMWAAFFLSFASAQTTVLFYFSGHVSLGALMFSHVAASMSPYRRLFYCLLHFDSLQYSTKGPEAYYLFIHILPLLEQRVFIPQS